MSPQLRRRSRIRRWALVLIVALAAIGIWWWLAGSKTPPPQYLSAPVTRGDVEETVLATGSLKPERLVAVGAQVSGRVVSVNVHVGDIVKKGALIAQIDSITQENKLRTAEAELSRLRAQRDEKRSSLKLYEQNLQRQEVMVARNAVSRLDYDKAVADVAIAKAQITALEAQIVSGQVGVDDARANLGYTRISAPIDGTVLAVVTQEGQTVSSIQSAPTIVILGQLDTMTVSAQISEADVVRVKPGQKVKFSIIGEPGKRYDATLASIDPAPDSIRSDPAIASSLSSSSSTASNTAIYYNGVFNVPNPDGHLRTYMTANAHIVLGAAKNVLTIPAAAIGPGSPERGYTVRVIGKNGVLERRRVKIGLNDKVTAEVLDGLKEGEQIVAGDGATGSAQGGPGGGPGSGRPGGRRPSMGL